jgi:hypothetical protein
MKKGDFDKAWPSLRGSFVPSRLALPYTNGIHHHKGHVSKSRGHIGIHTGSKKNISFHLLLPIFTFSIPFKYLRSHFNRCFPPLMSANYITPNILNILDRSALAEWSSLSLFFSFCPPLKPYGYCP